MATSLLSPSPPQQQNMKKKNLQNFIPSTVGMDLNKVHKPGRDDNTQADYTLVWNNDRKERQEDYPYTFCIGNKHRVVFLSSFSTIIP